MITIVLSEEAIKKQASILKKFINDNKELTHTASLHAISRIYGFKNFNTLKALLNKESKNENRRDYIKSD